MSRLLSAVLLMVGLTLVAGCGSGSSTSGSAPTKPSRSEVEKSQVEIEKSVKATARVQQSAEAKAPQGASPTLRGIYRSFPTPKKRPPEAAAAKALVAGEAACRGKTPVQVKERFYPAAEHQLEPEQARMIGRIASFEAKERDEQGFIAGQLAADTYAATLNEEATHAGYEGCVYSLAQQVERQLSPRKR